MYNVPQRLTIITLWLVRHDLIKEAKEIFKDYFSGLPCVTIRKSECNTVFHEWCAFIPNKYIDIPLSNFVGIEHIQVKGFSASLVSKGADYCVYNYANLFGLCLTIYVKTEDLEKLYLEDN